MRVAVLALRQLGPRSIIVALPVASRDAVAALSAVADDCKCLLMPEPFYGVGHWYQDFTQVSDATVHSLLAEARHRWETSATAHAAAGL